MNTRLSFTLIQLAHCAAFSLAAVALPAQAAAALDAAATSYFASPAFQQLLVDTVSPVPTCNTGANIRLEKLEPLEEVVMGAEPHPESGGWTVQFELEGCGRAQRHNLSFRASRGERPDFARLPDGDTRVTPTLYRALVGALGLPACTHGATVTASLYGARAPATIAGKRYATAWEEQWTVRGCGQAPRTIDLCIADAPVREKAWMSGRCGG